MENHEELNQGLMDMQRDFEEQLETLIKSPFYDDLLKVTDAMTVQLVATIELFEAMLHVALLKYPDHGVELQKMMEKRKPKKSKLITKVKTPPLKI
jgi:predicted metal-dependent hydrolase